MDEILCSRRVACNIVSLKSTALCMEAVISERFPRFSCSIALQSAKVQSAYICFKLASPNFHYATENAKET
jgi:hypothetical protein